MGESGLGINSNNIFLFASEIFSLHSYMYIKVVESNSNMFRTNVRDSSLLSPNGKVPNPAVRLSKEPSTACTDCWLNCWWSIRLSIWFISAFLDDYYGAFIVACGCLLGHHSWFDIHINSSIRHSPFRVTLCPFMKKICDSWGQHTVVIYLNGIEPLTLVLRTSSPVIWALLLGYLFGFLASLSIGMTLIFPLG